jgi:hypothetical protein
MCLLRAEINKLWASKPEKKGVKLFKLSPSSSLTDERSHFLLRQMNREQFLPLFLHWKIKVPHSVEMSSMRQAFP